MKHNLPFHNTEFILLKMPLTLLKETEEFQKKSSCLFWQAAVMSKWMMAKKSMKAWKKEMTTMRNQIKTESENDIKTVYFFHTKKFKFKLLFNH